MKIGGGGACGDDLVGMGADQPGEGGGETFGQGEPLLPGIDRPVLPLPQAPLHRRLGSVTEGPERIAVEVDASGQKERLAPHSGSSNARTGEASASGRLSGRQMSR